MGPHYTIPGVKIRDVLPFGALYLRCHDSRCHSADNPSGNLVLNRENVLQISVKSLRPQVSSTACLDELGCDPDSATCFPNAAFYYVVDVQFLANSTQIGRLALVLKGRIASDHRESVEAAQFSDYVLGDAVGEVLLLRIARHVGERQNGNGGFASPLGYAPAC